ncbi:hybrid sensor histidine kinase/response regulator [Bacteroidia bacterium]|nr:hybrid sensor histidine kinase/response regulator [Bacteroidia bacterium]
MKTAFAVLLSLLIPLTAIRSQPFEFAHLDVTNGLSNNQVDCIFKDSRGFMWLATNTGLNRYDGQNFEVYKYNKQNPYSIPTNNFSHIAEDHNGNLWLEAYESFYFVYDWRNESFIRNTDSILAAWQLPAHPNIIKFDHAKNQYLYYKDVGIYKYVAQTCEVIFYEQSEHLQTLSCQEIVDFEIAGDYLWALFKDGEVERFDTQKKVVDIRNRSLKTKWRDCTIPKKMFVDSDGDVWIYPGIGDKGLVCFDAHKQVWSFSGNAFVPSAATDYIRCIIQDSKALIWIGTDHEGITVLDKTNNRTIVLRNNGYDKKSICQNSIVSLFCDDNGMVWAGSFKNGVSYYHPSMFKFQKSPLYAFFSEKGETFDCNSICKDRQGYLWFGTNDNGLLQYNPHSHQFKSFKNDLNNPNSLSSNIITCIYQDRAQTLWIGTFLGGLNAYNGTHFKRYQLNENDRNTLSNKSVFALAEDAQQNLWIGTLGSGIDKLDKARKTFTHFNRENNSGVVSNYILSMQSNGQGIYANTSRGVIGIDARNEKLSAYFNEAQLSDSLTSTAITYSIVDSRNWLWLATNNGINIYDPSRRQFKYITTHNGLPNDEVVSLVEDNEGVVWAGTRKGLASVRCENKNGQLDFLIAVYDDTDGLPGSSFNYNAVYKDNEGLIYFGTNTGYVCFEPKKIISESPPPKLRFTELLIANENIKPNRQYNNRTIISKSITDLNEIILKHKETNFTLLFSAFNYIHSKKIRYKYKLEGLDAGWTESSNNIGAASYSNLRPRTYKLVVYTRGDDLDWNDTPLTMKIIVRPPFWFSWWAFVIYCLIFAGLIFYFMRYKLNKQKHEFEQTQRILEADKTHEVDELKFKFFTNISHEFKTPLTLILTPLEKLLKSPASDEQRNMFNIMYRNASNLLTMVTEILDFRKFDLNKMTVNKSTGEIISYIREICHSFSLLATEKNLKFTFTTYIDELYMEFDAEKIKKIITNLLSNAFKYTKEGQIDVSTAIYEEMNGNTTRYISIRIADTGIGLNEKETERIFERFYRVESAQDSGQSGSGVGLHLANEYAKLHGGKIKVESAEGKGSVFTVQIPVLYSKTLQTKNQNAVLAEGTKRTGEPLLDGNAEAPNSHHQNLPVLLIVDDNEDFCRFITSLFPDTYQVITALDGEEASQIVLDRLPDIILCDVMMPKMDGYAFCRLIKGDVRTSHIPIILLTAKSSDENKYKGIEAGADDYISKPFNIDMLTLKIAKIVEKQRNIQSHFKKKIDLSPSEIEITSLDEKFIKKAIAVVEENIDNPDFLVEDLCKEMAMSRVYFYKKLLSLTDKTPSELIRFIRIKRAASLLEKSQLNVNEVALQVGFNDPKYFRKYFKEEFGVTPNEYKKKFDLKSDNLN